MPIPFYWLVVSLCDLLGAREFCTETVLELYGVAPKFTDYSCRFISSVISTFNSILLRDFFYDACLLSFSFSIGVLELEIFSSLFAICTCSAALLIPSWLSPQPRISSMSSLALWRSKLCSFSFARASWSKFSFYESSIGADGLKLFSSSTAPGFSSSSAHISSMI